MQGSIIAQPVKAEALSSKHTQPFLLVNPECTIQVNLFLRHAHLTALQAKLFQQPRQHLMLLSTTHVPGLLALH